MNGDKRPGGFNQKWRLHSQRGLQAFLGEARVAVALFAFIRVYSRFQSF
jgi:hypothetical protein